MLPRLNNSVNIYNQTFTAGGDVDVTPCFLNLPCRFNENESLIKTEKGDYLKAQASMHCNFDIELDRKMVVEYSQKFYSIYDVKKVKDLQGNNLFQFVILTINKNVNA